MIGYRNFERLKKIKDFFVVKAPATKSIEMAGTDMIMEEVDIKRYLFGLPRDKHAFILVYCWNGISSRIIAKELVKRGYLNVFSLEGGI